MTQSTRRRGVAVTPMETRREIIVQAAILADELGYEVFSVAEGWGLDSTLVLTEIALRAPSARLRCAAMQPIAEPERPMTVRRARTGDRAEHARMRLALWPDEDADALASELETFLADPTQTAFVAERAEGGLCGFAEASVRRYANSNDESPCAFLEGWWVDADVRRGGVGRALIAAVEDWARAQGFTELGSDALLDNTLSHTAHRALGFEERERVIYFRKWL